MLAYLLEKRIRENLIGQFVLFIWQRIGNSEIVNISEIDKKLM